MMKSKFTFIRIGVFSVSAIFNSRCRGKCLGKVGMVPTVNIQKLESSLDFEKNKLTGEHGAQTHGQLFSGNSLKLKIGTLKKLSEI